jgi:hypothetical protein
MGREGANNMTNKEREAEIKALRKRILELKTKNREDVYVPHEIKLGQRWSAYNYFTKRNNTWNEVHVTYNNYQYEEIRLTINYRRERPIKDELDAYPIVCKYLNRLKKRADARRA